MIETLDNLTELGLEQPPKMCHLAFGDKDVALCGAPLAGAYAPAATPIDCVVCADIYRSIFGDRPLA
jgi:hypothetical protein